MNNEQGNVGVAAETAAGPNAAPLRSGPEPDQAATVPNAPARSPEMQFEVQGAGVIEFSHYGSRTGTARGFQVGCSWGKHGLAFGGVMDRGEAIALAHFILSIADPRVSDRQGADGGPEGTEAKRTPKERDGVAGTPKPSP